MEEDITILTAFLLSNIPEIITQEEFDEVKQAIEKLIKGYRELEKHIAFYEKHGSYKARIIELQEENESKEKAYNDCYCEFKHYKQYESIPKSKVKELHKEYYEKAFAEPYDCTTADYKHSQVIGGWRALNKLLMED